MNNWRARREAEKGQEDEDDVRQAAEGREFPTVPAELLERAKLRQLFSGNWNTEEPIHILEGRATLAAVLHAWNSPHLRHHKVLFLCDN